MNVEICECDDANMIPSATAIGGRCIVVWQHNLLLPSLSYCLPFIATHLGSSFHAK
jgi:hypothetical protein